MLYFLLLILLPWSAATNNDIQQIHLSVTGTNTSMAIDFVSLHTSDCSVSYCGTRSARSQGKKLVNIGWQLYALMTGLTPGSPCSYHITCGTTTSPTFSFTPGTPKVPTYAILADYGYAMDYSMNTLIEEVQKDEYHLLIHAGDIGYNLFSNHSHTGNEFLNAIQPVSTKVPYMVTVGNHEGHDNFTEYCQRFSQAHHVGNHSNSNSPFYYSWNSGLVHFISISTEVYMYPEATAASPYPFTAAEQLAWLEQDLIKANQHRGQQPWIVMYGHKTYWMDHWEKPHKHGRLITNFTGFDHLGCKYGVDLYFAGHVHLYQRFLPAVGPNTTAKDHGPTVVDRKCQQDGGHIYQDPKYMATIVVGSPGDQEVTFEAECDAFYALQPILFDNSMLVCFNTYGYGKLTVYNTTHAYWVWEETHKASPITGYETAVHVDAHKKDHDHLWVIQSKHGIRSYCPF